MFFNNFENNHQMRMGRNTVKIQQFKSAQYLTHLLLPPYLRFPLELASMLLLAFTLFPLVAALS
jgi:hypothetical protein